MAESQALTAQFRNPQIVRIRWQVVEDEAQMLLVMEYMEGGPVLPRDALAAGAAIPEDLARTQFRDMCKVGHLSTNWFVII